MPELSSVDQAVMSRMSSDMLTLLLLDDTWTEWVGRPRVRGDDFPIEVTNQMRQLLPRMGEVAEFIGSLPERMGDALQERFDALTWGEGLNTEDRDDLRWLVTRAGGVTEMASSTARELRTYGFELEALDRQVQRWQRGEPVEGDLSRKFRCGLGSGLLISGAASLPAAAMAGAGAAVAAGGAVAAGVIVGATGGVGAIALVVVGILLIRRQQC